MLSIEVNLLCRKFQIAAVGMLAYVTLTSAYFRTDAASRCLHRRLQAGRVM